jgi:hypothetical protein
MQSIIRWTVGLGVVWFVVYMGLTAFISTPGVTQNAPLVASLAMEVQALGKSLGNFIAPILQLALVLVILIAAAERFGFTAERRDWAGFAALSTANNVQAFIAVVIVGALVVGALAGIGRIDTLKDIALVVVGFYFGTRRSQTSINEAVEVGTAAGVAAAVQAAPPAVAADAPRPEGGYERTNPVP